jgi:MoxR-like ATPase
MRIELGYPDVSAERTLLKGRDRREMVAEIEPILQPRALFEMQQRVGCIHVSDALIDYIQALLSHSRIAPGFQSGLSPRAGLSLRSAAQAWAMIAGRNHVLPEDVQAVLPAVVGHRLRVRDRAHDASPGETASRLLREVPIP